MIIDLRKYFNFPYGSRNILALWNYDWLVLSGKPPYLDLPSTNWDTYSSTGRGYIQGRFRGDEMVDFESEYRFPITANGFLGAVVFANAEFLSGLTPTGSRPYNPAGAQASALSSTRPPGPTSTSTMVLGTRLKWPFRKHRRTLVMRYILPTTSAISSQVEAGSSDPSRRTIIEKISSGLTPCRRRYQMDVAPAVFEIFHRLNPLAADGDKSRYD